MGHTEVGVSAVFNVMKSPLAINNNVGSCIFINDEGWGTDLSSVDPRALVGNGW